MIYSTELANQIEIKENSNKYLEVGIQDNVKLESSRVDTSINGNTFLEVKFSKEGKELTHTEWEPNKKDGETEEQYQLRGSKQVKRIMQILGCFYPKEMLNFTGSSFKEFVNWVANLLNMANKSVLLKVKVVYNDKGYTTLPRYCNFTFIEPMALPEGQESKIAILSIDTLTRPIISDNETKEDNPLEAKAIAPSNDLPF